MVKFTITALLYKENHRHCRWFQKALAMHRSQYGIKKFYQDPSLLMGMTEYNRYLKEQQKEALDRKHHEYYDRGNTVIDYANENSDTLVIKDSRDLLDRLVGKLF